MTELIKSVPPVSAAEVKAVVDSLKSWEELTQERAMQYVISGRKEFKRRINQAIGLMPKNDNDHRVQFLNLWFDALIGNVVMTIAEYGEASVQTEDAVVFSIKNKFKALRATQLGAKGESVEVRNDAPKIQD